jgi:D-beta-D-heptose 7-phosphate kinase/D-beta-D-heptose 1-phosphate adenosyltransferase
MDLCSILTGAGTPTILLVGDLMLDRYVFGNADRVSPEAPVLVLSADQEEVRLGGAASVASLLVALEARVIVAGVVGDDASGHTVRRMLHGEQIDDAGVLCDLDRWTTVKERFVGRAASRHPHQILRVDREDRSSISPEIEVQLAEFAISRMDECQAVLISDYDKGVCTPGLLSRLFAAAKERGIPILVDPARIEDYGAQYAGAGILVPNRHEAQLATGLRIETSDHALAAAWDILQQCDAQAVIVKLDRDGMVLVQADGTELEFAARPRSVYDVTGAGDMVLAMLGLCLATGIELPPAIQLANVAAGLEVEKLGVVPVTRAEILHELGSCRAGTCSKLVTLDQLEGLADDYRRKGQKIVFTNGCFDLLHVGHVRTLEGAAKLGDVLFVGVNGDSTVRRLKGGGRPVIGETDRAAMIAALACVGHVFVFDDDTPHFALHRIHPDVLVKGGDYEPNGVIGREVVTGYGGRVVVLEKVDAVSTTTILNRIREPNSVWSQVISGLAAPVPEAVDENIA